MKSPGLTLVSILALLLCSAGTSYSWEPFDRVIAVVNDSPIIESEVHGKFSRLQKRKAIPPKKQPYEMSRLLDKLIEEALVVQEAEQQSIIISDAKVDNHIKKIMERMNISSLDDFKARVERSENTKFADYREDIRKSLITEQVMSLAIGVTPPSKKEAMEWYRLNREKLGFEVNLKHILLKPRNASLAEEKRVNEEIKKLQQRILRGESFEAVAASVSEDPVSAKKGGDLGWVVIAELDPYFANQVYRMNKPGQLSGAIKSGYGYHLVKYLGRRSITYDSVEEKIFNLLFQQKISEQFGKWIIQRRRESEVKIYMPDYLKG